MRLFRLFRSYGKWRFWNFEMGSTGRNEGVQSAAFASLCKARSPLSQNSGRVGAVESVLREGLPFFEADGTAGSPH